MTLKKYLVLLHLNKDIVKCGFPINSLDKYMNIFHNLNIDIKIINNVKEEIDIKKLLKKLEKIDIDNITPIESINILNELKRSMYE